MGKNSFWLDLHVPVKSDQHTININTRFLEDPKLSLKARGLFLQLLTYYPGPYPSGRDLAGEVVEGVRAVQVALTELETHGYLHRWMDRKPNGELNPKMRLVVEQVRA